MQKRMHYSPCVDRFLVCALHHEARRLRLPMTRLANQFLTSCLRDTPGWNTAHRQMNQSQQESTSSSDATRQSSQ